MSEWCVSYAAHRAQGVSSRERVLAAAAGGADAADCGPAAPHLHRNDLKVVA